LIIAHAHTLLHTYTTLIEVHLKTVVTVILVHA